MLHPSLWRDDHSTAQCTECAVAFSRFRCRRHHCRHCGGVFCDACTNKRLWLRPIPPASNPHHADSSSTRGSPAKIEEVPGVIKPTAAVVPPSSNRSASPGVANTSLSDMSGNEMQRSTGGDGAEATSLTFLSSAISWSAAPQSHSPPQRPRRDLATQVQPPKPEPSTAQQEGTSARVTENNDDASVNRECSRSSTTAMTAVASHPCGSSGGKCTASAEEAVIPALPPALASRPRNDGSCTTENSSCRSVSANSIPASSAAPQMSPCPLQYSGYAQESKQVPRSHQVSSSLFSANQDTSSHSTAAGDVLPQALATSETMVCFEEVPSPHLLRGSSATLGGRANVCASFLSDSLASQHGFFEHHNDQQQSQLGGIAGDDCALGSSPKTRRGGRVSSAGTPAAATRDSGVDSGDSANDIVKEDAYRRESYRVSVDTVQRITWYLCRVCHRCYDHLLHSAFDPDNTAAAGSHSSSQTPLRCYVRLCGSDEPLNSDDGTGDPFRQRGSDAPPRAISGLSAAAVGPTSEASSGALPLLSSMWARLRASVSLPASRSPSTMASPVMAAAATPSPSALSPLQTRELCQARGFASRRLNGKTSSAPAAAQASIGLSGSECISPVSLGAARENDSIVSLSAGSDMASPKAGSTHPRSPQPQQQQQSSSSKRVRRIVTPPRRRLISIDGSPGTLRQAVALARRRRRIAVILIDERDVAGADDPTEAQPQQQRAAQCESPPARPSAHADAETALRPSSVADQSGGARRTGRTSPIAAATGTALPVTQHTESDKNSTHQPKVVSDDKTAAAAVTQKSAQRPQLSILVGDVTLDDADGMSSAFAGGSGADAAALRGLSPAAWLSSQLPRQAAAPATPVTASRVLSPALSPSHPHEHVCFWASLSSSVGAVASTASPATSRPISCVPDGPQAVAAAFPVHSSGAATSPQAEGKLPALPAALDSGVCVLRALFCQIGAAVHFSTALTPTAAAGAAAAASGGGGFPLTASTTGASSFFADPASCGSAQTVAMPLWGTGPESYAAQRQALVRDMIHRYQLGLGAAPLEVTSPLTTALISSAYTVPLDQNDSAHWCGTASQRGAAGGLGSGSGGYMNATCRRFCGCSTTASHERVTAPVTTYFQVRPPAASTAAAPAAATAAVTILPVSTQVEVVGIPIDMSSVTGAAASTTSAAAATGAAPMGSTGLKSPHLRGGGVGSGAAFIPGLVAGDVPSGTSRPFTMAEFLPQLAKLSTNLDGYVIVILRRQSGRCASGGDRTSAGGDATATRPSPNGDSAPHPSAAQMGSDNSIGGPQRRQPDGGARQCSDAERLTSTACLSFPFREGGRCSAPRTAQPRDPNQRHRRRHRVTELFGGPYIRLLYQQLKNCGVAQPAISVVEVSDEGEVGAPKPSPVSLTGGKSPLEEASLYRDELGTFSVPHPKSPAATGGEDGVAEGWSGVTKTSPQNSALSASGISTASSVDSAQLQRPSSASTSAVAQSSQTTERTPHAPLMHGESFERLQLPASVCGVFGQTAKLTTPSVVPMTSTSTLEHAMASLRYAARQLGVSMCSMTYASETTAAMTVGASVPAVPASPGLKTNNSAGGSGSGDGALLSRALESLVATLVYRDMNAMFSQ
ncbi:hypothetical protein GH5_05124 [Leishmania sp. Ghana 2012 LV757]|uniref:hypothetical protein n=1 Tax=Leishmania sp. Ghana 2012 LV757 TaxID=2803181 RepID=UPI001B440785|nr:hypothetical protein GH5_05124 [Leishmania sp. Ghana 2012 LV757]